MDRRPYDDKSRDWYLSSKHPIVDYVIYWFDKNFRENSGWVRYTWGSYVVVPR